MASNDIAAQLAQAFEDFKAANDERLAALEKGRTDPLIEAKVDKANEDIARLQASDVLVGLVDLGLDERVGPALFQGGQALVVGGLEILERLRQLRGDVVACHVRHSEWC